MSKTFNAFEKATIKNSAKAVAHYQAKNDKLDEKIQQLEKEKEMNNAYIEQYSKPVVDLTGGYLPLELCEKVSRGSQNDWVFIYPDTIVPPVNEAVKPAEEVKEDIPDCPMDMKADAPYTPEEQEEMACIGEERRIEEEDTHQQDPMDNFDIY